MAKTKPRKLVKQRPPKLPPDPEIQVFLQRTEDVRKAMNIERVTLSKKLFDKQAFVLDNLRAGYGCNVVSFIEAQKKLAALEANLQAESAA